MDLRQLFDSSTSTFTYLAFDEDTKQGVLIDSVFEQHTRDLALIRELGVHLVVTLDTHVHADHVTGAWLMKEALGSQIVYSLASGVKGADRLLAPGEAIEAGPLRFVVLSTPGHTNGCVSYWEERQRVVFTGDALLIRGAGRTDFQEGDANRLFRSVHETLFSLPKDTRVFPAHDYSGRTMTTIEEEMSFNPRLGTAVREQDFVEYMKHLGLPHPGKIDIAVPANLQVGRPEEGWRSDTDDWGPVVRTYAGVLQVEPEWVRLNERNVQVVDVREEAELNSGPLGRLEGSMDIPLSELRQRLGEVPRDRPVIVVCPSGARSAMAATIIEKAGVPRVANLRGGLLEWKGLGYPLEK